MLVLSRKVGDRIVIGDGIVLVVKRIVGQRVSLGIEAPQQVHIVRGELKPLDGHGELKPLAAPPLRQLLNGHAPNSAAAERPRLVRRAR